MSAVNALVAYKFIKQLTTPFEKWDAYKLGLIDKDGQRIKKAETPEEKKAFPTWQVLIRNLKVMLSKIPLLGTRLGSFAVALFLLKEELELQNTTILEDEFEKHIQSLPILLNEENAQKINILEKGRYRHIPTNDIIFLKQNLTPVDEIYDTEIFKVTDSVTGKEYITTIEDLETF